MEHNFFTALCWSSYHDSSSLLPGPWYWVGWITLKCKGRHFAHIPFSSCLVLILVYWSIHFSVLAQSETHPKWQVSVCSRNYIFQCKNYKNEPCSHYIQLWERFTNFSALNDSNQVPRFKQPLSFGKLSSGFEVCLIFSFAIAALDF